MSKVFRKKERLSRIFFPTAAGWLLLPLMLCGILLSTGVVAQELPAEDGAVNSSHERKPVPEDDSGQGVSDPEMQEAIDQARSTLDTFLSFAEKPTETMSGFKLKVILREDQDAETFWVMPFRRTETTGEEEFEGELANTPEVLRMVRLGQTVRFGREEIVDWGFINQGRQIGSFTVCVAFRRIPKQQADYFRENNGFDC